MSLPLGLLTSGCYRLEGPSSIMEVLVDRPDAGPLHGVAMVAHPQPLLGGSARHKVPQFVAKSLADAGWLVVRPQFRGVGQSDGLHDHGDGETQDLVWLATSMQASTQGLALALVGISFGAFVQARVASTLMRQGRPVQKVCLVALPYGAVAGGRVYDTPQDLSDALVIHGERDEQVPLSLVLEWARPASQVVSVIPGADHLFTGKLTVLRRLILEFVSHSTDPAL